MKFHDSLRKAFGREKSVKPTKTPKKGAIEKRLKSKKGEMLRKKLIEGWKRE